jgi:hypothetical protein
MNPLEILQLGPESLSEIKEFASYFESENENGNLDAMDVYLRCTAMQKALEAIKSSLQGAATEEAAKYGKNFEKKSYEIKIGEVGTKYIFDNCNDPILVQRDLAAKNAKSQLDDRQKFLKSLKETLRVVDEETGESFVVNPPVKTSTTSLIVTVR